MTGADIFLHRHICVYPPYAYVSFCEGSSKKKVCKLFEKLISHTQIIKSKPLRSNKSAAFLHPACGFIPSFCPSWTYNTCFCTSGNFLITLQKEWALVGLPPCTGLCCRSFSFWSWRILNTILKVNNFCHLTNRDTGWPLNVWAWGHYPVAELFTRCRWIACAVVWVGPLHPQCGPTQQPCSQPLKC
jgi:hypothetical protein